MSKPDKYGDSSERDFREDFPEFKDRSAKAAEKDDLDDLESSDELLGDRAGMGKEIKIGLAVIAGLLIVLAVVVVRRITRPSEETASGGLEAAKHEDREHPPAKVAPGFPAAPRAAKSPVGPTHPGPARSEKKASSDDNWKFADDREKSPLDPRGRPEASMLPKEPGPASPSRFAAVGSGGDAAGRMGTWPRDEGRGPDSFSDRSIPTGSGFGVAPGSVRTPGPRSLADEPPRVESLAGPSPLRQSPGSFGATTGNTLRDHPADGARPGAADSDRGFGSAPRVGFGGKKGDDPLRRGADGGIASPPAWNQPPSVGLQTPRTLAPNGGFGDPASRAAVREPSSAPPGTRVYVVQPGDTIYDIAHSELGHAIRWNEIYQLNRDVLGQQANYITPGMRLLLPQESGGPGALTQRPAAGSIR
jgi:nucleoid-associated protein YgaU